MEGHEESTSNRGRRSAWRCRREAQRLQGSLLSTSEASRLSWNNKAHPLPHGTPRALLSKTISPSASFLTLTCSASALEPLT
ncbi:hypothetical protein GBA52_027954 [Prunus armeniaca]|nr:hypothetical protein GBA52_027954 [Prunus armeniaca]